jgi:SAM-dependent methyltransferase
MTWIDLCPVCGKPGAETCLERRFDMSFMSDLPAFEYALCRECGFVFARNPLDEAQAEAYYASSHRWGHVHDTPPQSSRDIWNAQARFLAGALSGPPAARALEVGCGPGYFLALLMERGLAAGVLGYELSGKALAHARERLGIQVEDAARVGLEEMSSRGAFDLLILRHVLEHIPFPDRYLATLLPLLGEQGALFIETPCLDLLDEHAQQFPVFEHVNYFTVRQMAQFLSGLGLEVFAWETEVYPPLSEKPYRVQRVLARRAAAQAPLPDGQLHAPEDFRAFARRSDALAPAERRLREVIAQGREAGLRFAFFSASNETTALLRRTGAAAQVDLAAVFDNNRAKWGLELEGVPVRPPEDIAAVAPDRIVIGSSAYQQEIRRELLDRGVPEAAIVTLWPGPDGEDA